MKGVVKEKRTSLYYGVRVDERNNKNGKVIYYRAQIMAENKMYYLGAYTSEDYAAFAFNVAFDLLTNGKYKIENYVELSQSEMQYIEQKVNQLMYSKGYKKTK